MYSKVNYTIIGLFVILFVAGIIFFAFWLGNRGFQDDYSLYLLRTKDTVAGLSKDSGVKLKGVEVGTVSDIRVNPKNVEEVEIVLKISKNIPIKEDMYGTLSMFGLTGLSFVEIEGGTNSAKPLIGKDGALPVLPSKSSMIVRLEENLEKLSDRLVAVLEQGEKLLSDENLKNFSSLIENANKVAAKGTDVEEKMISSLEEAQGTLREFRVSFAKLSKDYSALATDLNKSITPSLRHFDTMSQSVETLALKIEKTVNRGDYNMQKIMQPTLNDMRKLSAQIEELAKGLKQSPSDILYKSNRPLKGPGE